MLPTLLNQGSAASVSMSMPVRHVIWAQRHRAPSYSEIIFRLSFSIWSWKFTFSKPKLSVPQMFLFSLPVQAPHWVLLSFLSSTLLRSTPQVFIHKLVCVSNLGICCPGAVSNPKTHAETLNLYKLHFSYRFLYLQSVCNILFIPSPFLLPLTFSSWMFYQKVSKCSVETSNTDVERHQSKRS